MNRLFSAVVALLILSLPTTAFGFEGGGRKPSQAPLIAAGQHYTGQLNNHASDANYGSYVEVALWRLPPVTTHDVVTVDWHVVPRSGSTGEFPVCMVLAQGVDDFNWGTVFGSVYEDDGCDEDAPVYGVSGSGTARTEIVVQDTSATSSYLEFFSRASADEPARYETYPYDFTVEQPLHYLSLAMKPLESVSANGIVEATVTQATGLPAPDGLTVNLGVTWREGGIASYSTTTSGGVARFQLALPESAYGRTAVFRASHPSDGTFQAVTAPNIRIKITKPAQVPPSACRTAKRRKAVLSRQLVRLRRHGRRAHGYRRRTIQRRIRHLEHQLQTARADVAASCGH